MIESRCTAIVTTVALLSAGFGYSDYVMPVIKDCEANKTCSMQPTAVITTATTKNELKTTTVESGSPQIVRYDVSGNDSKGSTLKDVILIDNRTIIIPLGDDKTNGSRNATSGTSNITDIVKSSAGKANAKVTETNFTVKNATNTTSTTITTARVTTTTTATTTTQLTNISPTKYFLEYGAEVVHFIPNKYCHCDLIVSIC